MLRTVYVLMLILVVVLTLQPNPEIPLASSIRNAEATTVFSNRPFMTNVGGYTLSNTIYEALGFTTSASSENINQVIVPLSSNNTTTAVMNLYTDNAGNPGVSVGAFDPVNIVAGIQEYTFTPSATMTVSSNTTYWIVLSTTGGAGGSWLASTVSPTGVYTFVGTRSNVGGGWFNAGDYFNIEIDAGTFIPTDTPTDTPSPTNTPLPGTIPVTTTADELNTDGDCSLREAIEAANTNTPVDQCPAGTDSMTDNVLLSNGATYALSISGSDEDNNQTGDLDVLNNTASLDILLEINGGGTATIDANDIDRVFHVVSGELEIVGLTLTDGSASNGGILYNAGSLILDNTAVQNGNANNAGGIYHGGTNLTIENNSLIGGAGNGNVGTGVGGIVVATAGANTTITDSTISHNQATLFSGGGIYIGAAMTLSMTNTVVEFNTAQSEGGGMMVFGAADLTINSSTFQNNTASGGDGGAMLLHSINSVSVQNSIIQDNTASGRAGAMRIRTNTTPATVNNSCIVGNSSGSEQDVMYFNGAAPHDFTNNWWGDSNGPSGVGPGTGDSVSNDITYSPFLTAPILSCPDFTPPTATPTDTPTDTPTFTPTFTPITPTNTPVTPSSTPITPTDTPITPTLTPTCAIVVVPPTLQSPVHRTHTTDTTPTFTWSQVSGAQSYRLMVYTEDRSFEFKKRRVGQTSTSYTLTSAEALTPAKYLWRVRTQDLGCGTWTKWSSRNTLFVD